MDKNTEGCQHEKTRLRKRAGVPGTMVQRQCLACYRGVGESKHASEYSALQMRVLEPWADPELGFEPGPRAA